MFSALCILAFTVWYGLHIAYNSPFFLAAPPSCLLWKRIQAIAGTLTSTSDCPELRNYKLPKETVKFWIFRTLFYYATLPLIDIFFLLDDVFYGDYQKCSLDDAVFVIGGFRSGTTSLHRAIHLDEERFVSPRMFEVQWPYIWLLKFFDWLEERDPSIVQKFEAKLQGALGEDIISRHPMTWHDAEEDDTLLASWHYSGWYAGAVFAHPETLIHSGLQNQLPESAQKKNFELYKRAIQKIMYRRGNGRTLLAKNHMVNFLPILSKELPNAKFVDIARHPKDSFCSWYALSQSALSVLSRSSLPKEVAIPTHLRFWDYFTKAETDFFIEGKGNGGTKNNRTLITFNEYVKDQEAIVRKLYKQWGYKLKGTEFERRLVAEKEKHRNHKKEAKYSNPTLKELGLTEEMMNKRYADYITKCRL